MHLVVYVEKLKYILWIFGSKYLNKNNIMATHTVGDVTNTLHTKYINKNT